MPNELDYPKRSIVRREVNTRRVVYIVRQYDLCHTLTCGQAFRWTQHGGGTEKHYEGVVSGRWVRLLQHPPDQIQAEVHRPVASWDWLEQYLQVQVDIEALVGTFPSFQLLTDAVGDCLGLRILCQDPWECLASFILSTRKHINSIRDCVKRLSTQFGEPVDAPSSSGPVFAFPSPSRLANCTERELQECRVGFRAGPLIEAAKQVSENRLNLAELKQLDLAEARQRLMTLPGVGPKVAGCTLLFGLGFSRAFPIDTWVEKALNRLAVDQPEISRECLHSNPERIFGPYAGYAQQYLFHSTRLRKGLPRVAAAGSGSSVPAP